MKKYQLLSRCITYTFALLAILLSSAIAILQIPSIREQGVQRALDQLYCETGWKIRAKSISGFLPFHFHAEEVTITNPHSLVISIKCLDAYYSPIDLILQHFTSPYLCAKEVEAFGHSLNAEGQIDFSLANSELSAKLLISFLDLPINPTNINIHGIRDRELYSCSLELTQRPDIVIKGTFSLDEEMRFKDSDINLYANDIQDLEMLRFLPLGGKISSHIEISGPLFQPTLAIEINSPNLNLYDYSLSDVSFNALATTAQDQFVSPFTMQATLNGEMLALSSHVSWRLGEPLRITEIAASLNTLLLSGNVNIDVNTWTAEGMLQATIDNLAEFDSLLSGKGEFVLTCYPDQEQRQSIDATVEVSHCLYGPFTMEYAKGQCKCEDLFHSPSGNIGFLARQMECGDIKWDEVSLSSQLCPSSFSLWPYSFSASGQWYGEQVQLITSGEWRASQDSIDFSLDVLTGKGGKYAIDLQHPTRFHLDPHNVLLEPLEVTIGQDSILAKINTQDREIQGHISADSIPIELVNVFLFPEILAKGIVLTGNSHINIDIGGTWAKPTVHGEVRCVEGTYESLNSGAVIQDIQATVEVQQDQILLKELHGNTGKNGTIQANGLMQLDKKGGFPFQLHVHFDKAALVHLDYAQATASGQITCEGNIGQAVLSGDIVLDQALIKIPETLPVNLQTVEVTYAKNKETTHPSLGTSFSLPITLDIHLSIPKKASVTGRDLTSEWKGNISLQGTFEEPLLYGKAKMLTGEYLFNGREFKGSHGIITFAGDSKKTTLYVVAEREIENHKIEAILKGPINDPKLSLRSNPPLPEREILSWILFNRGISEITGFQRSELNSTQFTLSAGKGDSDMLSRLRNTVGIDRVEISKSESGESEEISLKFGKYLSKGVFISLNKSINAESNQIAIEANVFKNVKAQAEVGDNSEGKISLKWTKDY